MYRRSAFIMTSRASYIMGLPFAGGMTMGIIGAGGMNPGITVAGVTTIDDVRGLQAQPFSI